MKRKTNFTVHFTCEELGIDFSCALYSAELQKQIRKVGELKEKVRITHTESDLLLMMLDLWSEGALALPKRKGIDALAQFIFDTFRLPNKRKPEEDIKLQTIKSKLYKLKG